MKVPKGGGGGAATSASLGLPAVVVILVLMLGATVYLWRARYIRRQTAYILMLVLALGLLVYGAWLYQHPMQSS